MNQLCLDFVPLPDSKIGEVTAKWDIVLGLTPEACESARYDLARWIVHYRVSLITILAPQEFQNAQRSKFHMNKDGKLTKDELPERMRGIFARADTDRDGFLTKDELLKMTQAEAGGRREGERGEGRGPGRPGPNGNPAAFIDRLFELDIDKDGKLSREELSKLPD